MVALFLFSFVAGAAAVALWLHVRLGERAPRSWRGAGLHVGCALALGAIIVPVVTHVLIGAGIGGRLASIMAVSFPALAYGCLAAIWMLRLATDALGRSLR